MPTPEERRSKALFDRPHDDLRALTNSLDKHTQAQIDATAERYSSAQQAQNSNGRVPVVFGDPNPKPAESDTDSKKKKWTSFEKWSFRIQGLLFLATAAAFGAAYWYAKVADIQKNEMVYKQTPKIIESADAAKISADTSRLLTEGMNEAICNIVANSDPDFTLLTLGIANVGKVSAKAVTAHFEVTVNRATTHL